MKTKKLKKMETRFLEIFIYKQKLTFDLQKSVHNLLWLEKLAKTKCENSEKWQEKQNKMGKKIGTNK